jgi:hypothetical protein
MSRSARINGNVEYRVGDGASVPIRHGSCEVDVTALDATISWTDGDTHSSTAIPIADYRRHLSSKAILVDHIRARET